MSSERWTNKVVDAPSPFRAHSSHRRSVDSPNLYVSTHGSSLPGPTPTHPAAQRSPRTPSSLLTFDNGHHDSQRKLRFEAAASLIRTPPQEIVERRGRRSVTPPRTPSPFSAQESLGSTSSPLTNSSGLYSKRMSPLRNRESSGERPLSTATTDVDLGRGRLHTPQHRNYEDTMRSALYGVAEQLKTPTRPFLKNAESAKCSSGHWKPSIEKRCVSPHRPSLLGILRADVPPKPLAPYKLLAPYGVS